MQKKQPGSRCTCFLLLPLLPLKLSNHCSASPYLASNNTVAAEIPLLLLLQLRPSSLVRVAVMSLQPLPAPHSILEPSTTVRPTKLEGRCALDRQRDGERQTPLQPSGRGCAGVFKSPGQMEPRRPHEPAFLESPRTRKPARRIE